MPKGRDSGDGQSRKEPATRMYDFQVDNRTVQIPADTREDAQRNFSSRYPGVTRDRAKRGGRGRR